MAIPCPSAALQLNPARSRCRAWALVPPLTALLVLAVGTAACSLGATPAAPATDEELVQGREIYIVHCASCHGTAGQGGRGAKLDDGWVLDRFPDPAAEVAVIANGVGEMPAFADELTDAQVDAVVRFTREVLAVHTEEEASLSGPRTLSGPRRASSDW